MPWIEPVSSMARAWLQVAPSAGGGGASLRATVGSAQRRSVSSGSVRAIETTKIMRLASTSLQLLHLSKTKPTMSMVMLDAFRVQPILDEGVPGESLHLSTQPSAP